MNMTACPQMNNRYGMGGSIIIHNLVFEEDLTQETLRWLVQRFDEEIIPLENLENDDIY